MVFCSFPIVVVRLCSCIAGIDWLPVCTVLCWRFPALSSFFPTPNHHHPLSLSLALSLSVSVSLAPTDLHHIQLEHVVCFPHSYCCLNCLSSSHHAGAALDSFLEHPHQLWRVIDLTGCLSAFDGLSCVTSLCSWHPFCEGRSVALCTSDVMFCCCCFHFRCACVQKCSYLTIYFS